MQKAQIHVSIPSEEMAKKDRLLEALRKTNGELISALKDAKAQVGVERGRITSLTFRYSWVTDAGLEAVAEQVHVKTFESSNRMTDAGLKHLRDMREMESMTFNEMDLLGDGLPYLAGMKKLRGLQICSCQLTDVALKHFPDLPGLRMLNLQCAQGFSDDALKQLARLVNLEDLTIDGATITGAGVRHLQPLQQLRRLSLRGVDNGKVTDDALVNLPAFPKLEQLQLHGSAITNKGVARMPVLPSLEWLDLSRTKVSDVSLQHIAKKFPALKYLELNETRVKDSGVRHLINLQDLVRVNLNDTGVTVTGVRGLLEAKSGLHVSAVRTDESEFDGEKLELIERLRQRRVAPVAQTWDRIERWFKKYLPRALDFLRPPATQADIAMVEKRIGRPLPNDFRESYLIHDGQDRDPDDYGYGLIFGMHLRPLIEGEGILWLYEHRVEHEWPKELQWYELEWTFYPPDAIRRAWNGPGWIPVFWDVGRNFLGIDLEPGPNGVVGQVIPFGGDDRFRPVLALSWGQFLQDIADELEAGHAVASMPQVTAAPFRLRGAPRGYFANCYEQWARAKLPRAFQNVKPVPKRPPEDDAIPITGDEAEQYMNLIRDFFKEMNEFERHWLTIRPLRELGLSSLQDCGPNNTRGWSHLPRYPDDEPKNEIQRLLWDKDAKFDEQAEALGFEKHYKPAITQKQKIWRRYLTRGKRAFDICFIQKDPPWYDPSLVQNGEVRKMADDHVFVDFPPFCHGGCSGEQRWRFHLRHERGRWRIDYHEEISNPEKIHRLDLP